MRIDIIFYLVPKELFGGWSLTGNGFCYYPEIFGCLNNKVIEPNKSGTLHEFEKWTMITFVLVSAALVTGLIILLVK
jgi:hypothetical protein